MGRLAREYQWLARHSESIALRQQALESSRAALGPDHPETRQCKQALAYAYLCDGQVETSARLLEQVLEQQRALDGATHPATPGAMSLLARNYLLLGRLPESLALYEEFFALRNTGFGRDHVLMGYVEVCQWAGKYEQVDKPLRDALKMRRPDQGSFGERSETANLLGFLALNLLLQERYDEAEPIAREAVAMNRTEECKYPYWVSILGAVFLGQKKYVEAEPLLLKGYEGLRHWQNHFLEAKWRMTEVGRWIVYLYDASNQPEKARMWRAKLETEAQASRQQKEVHWHPKRGLSPRDFP
jgi:tetratricopeptide (TPR) repeat protein